MNRVKQEPNSKQSNKSNMEELELDRPGKLMVSGIPRQKDYSNSELEKHFSPFGRITEGEGYIFVNCLGNKHFWSCHSCGSSYCCEFL